MRGRSNVNIHTPACRAVHLWQGQPSRLDMARPTCREPAQILVGWVMGPHVPPHPVETPLPRRHLSFSVSEHSKYRWAPPLYVQFTILNFKPKHRGQDHSQHHSPDSLTRLKLYLTYLLNCRSSTSQYLLNAAVSEWMCFVVQMQLLSAHWSIYLTSVQPIWQSRTYFFAAVVHPG